MRAILIAIVSAVVIAAAVGYPLFTSEKPIYETLAEPASVRLGDPGENLVGPNWWGLYPVTPEERAKRQVGT